MDETTKTRFLEILDRRFVDLTVRELGFLLVVLDQHEEEAISLVPELAGLL